MATEMTGSVPIEMAGEIDPAVGCFLCLVAILQLIIAPTTTPLRFPIPTCIRALQLRRWPRTGQDVTRALLTSAGIAAAT